MTELDHTVLAIVARDGPMSAYDVRKVFAASLTPSWSSSAGSIYPSIRRLAGGNLVSLGAPKGGRETRALSITPAGKAALADWLTGNTAAISAATPDPIRTRCYFLPLMSEAKRQSFLEDALSNTENALEAAELSRHERLSASADAFRHLISEGVIYQLKARRDWLQMLIRELGNQAPALPTSGRGHS
jgi:DNA-binding PadR family transcriptional regulator